MVIYCPGRDTVKRRVFNSFDCTILDNEEVFTTFTRNGHECFAVSAPPFADFTVSEKLAFEGAKFDETFFAPLAVKSKKRFGSLDTVQQRAVVYCERITDSRREKPLVINLDGTVYSKKRARLLARFLALLPNPTVFIFISDDRFVPQKALTLSQPVRRRALVNVRLSARAVKNSPFLQKLARPKLIVF